VNHFTLLEGFGAIVFDRPEQRAVVVFAVAGGVEVVVDQRVGAGVQREIADLVAFAVDGEMRHATPFLPISPAG